MEKPDLKGIKDKKVLAYIDYLETQLSIFTESPYVDSYLSIKKVIDKGNKQIADKDIDLFSDEGQKQYKSIQKFTNELNGLQEQMDIFRGKMNPAQVRELKARMEKDNLGLAEKMALKNGNGN